MNRTVAWVLGGAASLALALPAAAQDRDPLAWLYAHMAREKQLVATAEARSTEARDLIGRGRRADAVEPMRAAVEAYMAIAAECGRVIGHVTLGCAQDETRVSSELVYFGNVLSDLGRADQGVAAFDKAIATFKPRWQGCGGQTWGNDCDDSAWRRRAFMADYARFLGNIGRKERAAELLRDNLAEQRAGLATCPGDGCIEPDSFVVGDFERYRAALTALDKPAEALALDREWLPLLAASGPYTRGAASDAKTDDKELRERIDESFKLFAETAAAAGQADAARPVLARFGHEGMLSVQAKGEDFAAELASIQAERRTIGGFDDVKLAASARRKQALFARQHGEDSLEFAEALREEASAHKLGDRFTEAEPLFRRNLEIVRKLKGDAAFQSHYAAQYLADLLTEQGRKREALAILQDILDDPVNARGSGSEGVRFGTVDVLEELRGDYAQLLLEVGDDPAQALAAARKPVAGIRAFRDQLGTGESDERTLDMFDSFAAQGSSWLGRPATEYFVLAADALWSAQQRDAAGTEEAFMALQDAGAGVTTRAVARAAAARVAKSAGVSGLIAERARLAGRIDALFREATELKIEDPVERQRKDTALTDERARASDRRAEIDRQIAAAAPVYFDLVRPRPLTLDTARAMFGEDEAALLVVPTAFGTHVMVIDRDGIEWRRAELPEARLNQMVRRLQWDVGGNVEVSDEESARWAAEGEGPYPFDRGTAHELYRELVAPFVGRLAARKHLYVVASGALASLPFSLLVTEPPQGRDGDAEALRRTSWLADRFALLQLPSLQSLQLLRAAGSRDGPAKGSPGGRLLGFGDPVLAGEAESRGGSPSRRATRSAGMTIGQAWSADTADGPALADVESLRKLERLPGTARELEAMRGAFGADRSRIVLGAAATEAAFKAESLTGLRVLTLATHGLLAGEASGLAEPGLVLTPPATPTVRDDGLLSASEIAGLELDAEWVILSACNTAAGDGASGSPGLSGLARSFFFAGAQSLLVSHWPVKDAVAERMTVRVIELERANPAWSRAQALQAAMREIRDDPIADADLATWAHPSAWAPFTLIGDAAR